MGTWDYRLTVKRSEILGDEYAIAEVYYGPDGPWGWCRAVPYGDTPEEVREAVELMLAALDANEPVLDVTDEEAPPKPVLDV